MLSKQINISDLFEIASEICASHNIKEIFDIQDKLITNKMLCSSNIYSQHNINLFTNIITQSIYQIVLNHDKLDYNDISKKICSTNMNDMKLEKNLVSIFDNVKIFTETNLFEKIYLKNGNFLKSNKTKIKIIKNDLFNYEQKNQDTNIIILNIDAGGIINQLFIDVNYSFIFDQCMNCFHKNKKLDIICLLFPQNVKSTYKNYKFTDLFTTISLYYVDDDEPICIIIISKHKIILDNLNDKFINYKDTKNLFVQKYKEFFDIMKESKNKKIMNYLNKYI